MALLDEAAASDGPVAVMKKLAWTNEEDAVLQEQVNVYGPQNWATISEALPGRNAKSCRLRWCQHLSPDVETVKPFTPQEDEKIMANYSQYKRKWSTISHFLPGRSDNAIKNRWNSVLRKVYHHRQQLAAAAAAIHRRPPDGTLALFPLAPGDVKKFGRDMTIPPPVLHHPLPGGVDLSGDCLKLFPLVPGDLVRDSNASKAEAMFVDYSTHESLVDLRFWPSTNHGGAVQGNGQAVQGP